jgi:hypothetical protein
MKYYVYETVRYEIQANSKDEAWEKLATTKEQRKEWLEKNDCKHQMQYKKVMVKGVEDD